MFSRQSVLALALAASVGVANANNSITADTPLSVDAQGIRHLLSRAVQEDGDYDYANMDLSFLAAYSVKFQGCHHVQQWNEEAQDEEDVKILTKRLVRFRMCPASDCSDETTGGCSSGYGDYVVDMETFMGSFMGQNEDGGGNGDGYCNQMNGGRRALADNADGNYNGQYDAYDEDAELFTGPYCADQGGEIKMGVFQDDTCSVFASSMYQTSSNYATGGLITTQCMSCGNGYGATSDFCTNIYTLAGKCETKMRSYYPNEASCSYIEGIKIIREDGVIRTSNTKRSKAAAVAIGLFLTVALLLAGYIYYLRTKLSRAKINLNAASQSLA